MRLTIIIDPGTSTSCKYFYTLRFISANLTNNGKTYKEIYRNISFKHKKTGNEIIGTNNQYVVCCPPPACSSGISSYKSESMHVFSSPERNLPMFLDSVMPHSLIHFPFVPFKLRLWHGSQVIVFRL